MVVVVVVVVVAAKMGAGNRVSTSADAMIVIIISRSRCGREVMVGECGPDHDEDIVREVRERAK